MLGKWKNAKLRSAVKALDAGRIDDAFELARSTELSSDQARELVQRLSSALCARIRTHLQAGRFADAVADLGRLAQLGPLTAEAQALQERAQGALEAGRLGEESRRQALEQAENDLRAGRLDSARQALHQMDDGRQRDALERDLRVRETRIAEMMNGVRAALGRDDVFGASAIWTRAVVERGRNHETEELGCELGRRITARVEQWLRTGRLDQLVAALDATAGIRQARSDLAGLSTLGLTLREAARQLALGDFAALNVSLARLAAHSPAGPPEWLTKALSCLREIDAAGTALLACPLGVIASTAPNEPVGVAAKVAPARGPAVADVDGKPAPAAARQFNRSVVLIDGAGSSLLIAADLVRIGRANGRAAVDIPLPADIQSHHADIARTGEDYFLVAHGPVRVNDRGVSRTLLRDGDRVRLGDSPELTFRRPSHRSSTACLRLSSRCRLPHDVGQVLLFSETCLIGPQSHCHIQAREARGGLLLFEEAGRLMLRALAGGPALPLEPNKPVEAEDVRITLAPYAIGDGWAV